MPGRRPYIEIFPTFQTLPVNSQKKKKKMHSRGRNSCVQPGCLGKFLCLNKELNEKTKVAHFASVLKHGSLQSAFVSSFT